MWGKGAKEHQGVRDAGLIGRVTGLMEGGLFDAFAEAGEVGAHGFGVVAGDDVL